MAGLCSLGGEGALPDELAPDQSSHLDPTFRPPRTPSKAAQMGLPSRSPLQPLSCSACITCAQATLRAGKAVPGSRLPPRQPRGEAQEACAPRPAGAAAAMGSLHVPLAGRGRASPRGTRPRSQSKAEGARGGWGRGWRSPPTVQAASTGVHV